ncbi:hypothetical protein [Nocardia niigatensis]|uniref:hypothetical protein n=1 Tax=Nocardia niigatensis TaxID=209249 RepID=UPI0002E5DD51|nr:hypothetical protein [Nocardia niigatensis]
MARRIDVHVPVVLAVPAVSAVLWGFFAVVVLAAVLAAGVSCAHFSDGNSPVSPTLGPCEPFCALRSDAAPIPTDGAQR